MLSKATNSTNFFAWKPGYNTLSIDPRVNMHRYILEYKITSILPCHNNIHSTSNNLIVSNTLRYKQSITQELPNSSWMLLDTSCISKELTKSSHCKLDKDSYNSITIEGGSLANINFDPLGPIE